MLSANEKITMRQLQILIILSTMGTGVIILPRRVAEIAGQDGWVVVIGLVFAAMFFGFLISAALAAVAKIKPGGGFFEVTGLLLTKPAAYVCCILLWIKLVLSAGLELKAFLGITTEILLPTTPMPIISGVMIAVCAYAAAKGIEARARVGEVLLGLMILPFLFLFILAVLEVDFSNLQPVMVTSPAEIGHGVFRLGFIFTGLETLLLVAPFLYCEKKNLIRPVVTALGFAGFIVLCITILTIAMFGQGVVNQPWPVLAMMDMITLPGAFIERQEALIFSFWIITAFALVNGLLFFGGILVRDMLHKPRGLTMGVLVTSLAVFAVTAVPLQGDEIYNMLDFLYVSTGIFFLVILPLFLLASAKFSTRAWSKKIVKGMSLLLIISFTACWDKVEIEDRAFIVAMAVDSYKNEYTVTLSIPEEETIKTATAETLTQAFKELDSKTDKSLYYGQMKLLILGSELLKNETQLKNVVSVIDNSREISCRIQVIASEGKASEILEIKNSISKIYEDKTKGLNFQNLNTAINHKNCTIIPLVSKTDDKETILNGAAVLKNHKKIGTLTQNQLRGYLWVLPGGGNSAVVNANNTPMKVNKHNVNIVFDQNPENKNLRATVNVTVSGQIKENNSNPTRQRTKGSKAASVTDIPPKNCGAISRQIKKEINTTAAKLQNELAADGYDFLQLLRKKNFDLYKIYSENWDCNFVKMEIVPVVSVKIT